MTSNPFNLSEVLHQDHRPSLTCRRCVMKTSNPFNLVEGV